MDLEIRKNPDIYSLDDPLVRIGGVEIQYYYTCKRELWFKLQQISPPQDDEYLTIGKQIHEKSYPNRSRREIVIGDAKIDMILSGKDPKLIEIKKSTKMILPTKRQLQYYMLLLEKQGIIIDGEIRIPREKKIINVDLTEEVRIELMKTIHDIESISNLSIPPTYEKLPYCKKCAYRPICEA